MKINCGHIIKTRRYMILLTWVIIIVIVFFLKCKFMGNISLGFNHDLDIGGKFFNFNNKTGVSVFIIPNIVHYVIFDKTELDFITYLSIMSALKMQKPDKIIIHTDNKVKQIEGKYWNLLQKQIKSVGKSEIEVHFLDRPTHVFGNRLSSIWHASDVARILVLMKYGGMYLDTDQLILKSLEKYRHFEMVLGWPERDYMGSQILLANAEARFLKLWLQSYRNYRPRIWYYNAGKYPTTSILERHPELVHRVKKKFGVQLLQNQIWGNNSWTEWKEFYSIHLLSRHPPAKADVDENDLVRLNCPFAEMAKLILDI